MALKKWKLQDAKNHFSEVVENAMHDGPQEVTKRGAHAVVILSYEKYQELIKPKDDLVSFFKKSPLRGLELDFERVKDNPREIEF